MAKLFANFFFLDKVIFRQGALPNALAYLGCLAAFPGVDANALAYFRPSSTTEYTKKDSAFSYN